MILAALLLAAVPPTADELYRNCVPVIEEDYHSQLRDLLCMSITTGGYSVAKNRDAQVGVQRFCLPPGVSLEKAANTVRDWLRANPGRTGKGHAIAADALTDSFPCSPPEEPTP